MAQSGFTPIVLYHSTTATNVPLAADLNAGELALNTNDEKLYFKNSTGTVKLLASSAATTNVSSITFGSTGLTPNTATTGAVTVAGTLAIANGGTGSTSTTYCSLTTNVTGTLPIANGGTGTTSTTFTNLTTNVTGTLPVANGGTGRATNTEFAVICGGTTAGGVEQSIASVGTAAQVLTSNGAGALPTFQTPAAGGTTIPSGTVMLFGQTAAPTGFTKLTNQDNASLRVVSGTASTGGSVNFTTAFASQTPTGSVSITSVSGSAGNTTLTTPQIPSHAHKLVEANAAPGRGGGFGHSGDPTSFRAFPTFTNPFNGAPSGQQTLMNTAGSGVLPIAPGGSIFAGSDNTGGGGSHDHPFSFSSGSGTFSGNAINLAVKFVDVIRATKD